MQFISIVLYAQPVSQNTSDYSFRVVGIREGLSQSTVLNIYQDHYGFIWLGTRNGLNRYDGNSFKIYRNKFLDKKSLAGNVIYKIQEDAQYNLWVANNEGLSFFDRKSESFVNYKLPGMDRPDVLDVAIDKQGVVWAACAGGLFIFDQISGQFVRAGARFHALLGIDNQYISTLLIQENTLIAGTNTNGLYLMDLLNSKIKHIHQDLFVKYGQSSVRINAVVRDLNHALWIGTNGNGLLKLQANGTINWFNEHISDERYNITNNNVRSLAIDRSGNIWAGTFNGLNVIRRSGQVEKITYEDKNPSGISHSSIRSLFTDREGSVWIGTYFGGVNIFNEEQQKFKHYYHISGDRTSLSYNVVGAFTESLSGKLIVGTERGGINIFNRIDGKIRSMKPAEKATQTVKALYTSKDGKIWAGIFKGGLQQLDEESGALKPADAGQNYPLNTCIINSITEDSDGNLWVATDGLGGIHKYSPQQNAYLDFKSKARLQDILNVSLVRHLLFNKNGNLLIATRGKGLVHYDTNNGSIRNFPALDTITKEINHIFQDNSGRLWLSTNGKGVIQFDPQTSKAVHIHTAHGLPDNVVYGILPDRQGYLWISTLTGFSIYDPVKKRFKKNFKVASVLPLNEINEGAFFATATGRFLAGGNNGFIEFDPLSVNKQEHPIPVIITQINVLGQHAETLYILGGHDAEPVNVVLKYNQPVFGIEYTSLNYLKPQMSRYEYRLTGLDDTWYALDDKRSITFSSLPSGRYSFEVRSSSDGLTWVSSKKAIHIRILPPPWLSWWAIALYILAALGIMITIRHNELKKNRLANDLKIEQIEKNRWREIHDIKLQYFTDVSHEFRTPLTLITAPMEELMNDENNSSAVKKKLHMIYYNSKRLLLLIDQILDINRLEAGRLSLDQKSVAISRLLQNIIDSFASMAERLSVRLEYTPVEDDRLFLVDIDKLEKIFYNLFSNAFKFTPPGGKISLNYQVAESPDGCSRFTFFITDTGKGMPPEHSSKIFERFYKADPQDSGAGVGLALTSSLVKHLGGTISVESELGQGSTFRVDIPFEPAKTAVQDSGIFLRQLPTAYVDTYADEIQTDFSAGKDQEIILVAEDNPEINTYLADALSSDKFKVITAKNGRKAWELAQKHIPDVIISDVLMPDMNGLELCLNVKSNMLTSHIPVIMLTAKTDDQSRISGLETGADEYLSKPFLLKELRLRIDNLLTSRKRLQQKFQAMSGSGPVRISVNKHDQELLDKINRLIEANIKNAGLGVDFICDKIGMSREHLFRKLKAITGLAPSDFIRDYRLNRAAALLVENQLKVAEAAYEVGYQDVAYFSKSFKKKFNCSPNQYAQKASE